MKRNNIILLAVGSLLTAFLIYYSIRYKHYSITSVSMASTLMIDDIILIDSYFKKVKKDNIYVLHNNENEVIYRVIAMPGDEVSIKETQLFVNQEKEKEKDNYHYNFVAVVNQEEFNEKEFENHNVLHYDDFSEYVLSISNKEKEQLSKQKFIHSIQKIIYPRGHQYKRLNITTFPETYLWSRDDYGPVIVPGKEMKLLLNKDNVLLYKMVIEKYEENKVSLENNDIIINNKKVDSYTFKNNYYWVMGDNRHQAKDSRFIGFIPESDFVGELKTIIYSPNHKKEKFFIDAE